jgi:hypothetical protein
VFAYGSKQLGEYMIGVKNAPFSNLAAALKIGSELYLGIKRGAPRITGVNGRLQHLSADLERRVQNFSHQLKLMFKEHEEKLITSQMIQARLSMAVVWIHAMACSLSRLDMSLRKGLDGVALEHDMAVVNHVFALGGEEIDNALRDLWKNTDAAMRKAAAVALKRVDALPNADYSIPERTPDMKARGTGRQPDQTNIQQFGSGSTVRADQIPGAATGGGVAAR